MTYSIGFRAPDYQQLLEPWLTDFAEHATLRDRYRDAGIAAVTNAGALPPAMVRKVHARLAQHRPTQRDTRRFLLRWLTEPKATTVFSPPAAKITGARFERAALAHGLKLDRRTRLIYSQTAIAINGEVIQPPAGSLAVLKPLANQRELSAAATSRAPASVWPLLREWYDAGWIRFID